MKIPDRDPHEWLIDLIGLVSIIIVAFAAPIILWGLS